MSIILLIIYSNDILLEILKAFNLLVWIIFYHFVWVGIHDDIIILLSVHNIQLLVLLPHLERGHLVHFLLSFLVELLKVWNNSLSLCFHVWAHWLTLTIIRKVGIAWSISYECRQVIWSQLGPLRYVGFIVIKLPRTCWYFMNHSIRPILRSFDTLMLFIGDFSIAVHIWTFGEIPYPMIAYLLVVLFWNLVYLLIVNHHAFAGVIVCCGLWRSREHSSVECTHRICAYCIGV
jgi:hypothetical protein